MTTQSIQEELHIKVSVIVQNSKKEFQALKKVSWIQSRSV